MKIKRKGATLRVDMQSEETIMLTALLQDLSAAVVSDDLDDPVVRRLYPDGYSDDADAAAEFRELVAGSLQSERVARLTACQADLPIGGGRLDLDDEAADRWLRVLNDLRLTMGTRLGVSEEHELAESDQTLIYHWLSAVQETMVQELR